MPTAAPDTPATPATPATPEPQERLVTTEHRLSLGKKTLEYSATCGTVNLRDYTPGNEAKDGQRKPDKTTASLFFVAYTRKTGKKDAPRPITFSFKAGRARAACGCIWASSARSAWSPTRWARRCRRRMR